MSLKAFMNPDPDIDLVQRVANLEQKLDDLLLLLSDVYRYSPLRDLLAAGQWKEADLETTRVMIELAGKTHRDLLTPENVLEFSCNNLQLIDELWRKYSRDKFSFTIQLGIYQQHGGNLDTLRSSDSKVLHAAYEAMGWLKENELVPHEELRFDIDAPRGHLPGSWWRSPYGSKMIYFFFTRLLTCDL